MPVAEKPLTQNRTLVEWVDKMARLTQPDRVQWCTGDQSEYDELIQTMLASGDLVELNQEKWPGCYLHRSNPNDVARTENLTFICSRNKEDAGPTNNWMSPDEAHKKVGGLFEGCMKGRTMYVIPYLMGPVGGGISKFGVEITDSAYVVANMRIMTRMGRQALDHLGDGTEIVYGMHSIGDVNPERRFICHLPEERLIMSFGSGYGGNALLGKKCFALRLASAMAREQGWMAEHMLILGLQDPQGRITYICAAFPSACGKTNLAMLVPPDSVKGWKVWTVGDDISWLRIGEDGRLWAVNPEAGFFGVAPGTSRKTNPNAMAACARNTIFTNVAMTEDGEPWWEGMDGPPPARATDWQGNPWTPESGSKAAHPNSRFTAPATQCPCISPEWENPKGVPISAFLFGSRRAKLSPLMYEAFDWNHGVFSAAMMASETTAAATGAVGVVRRDPMAMLPFCGYNMADYWSHWIEMGRRIPHPPKIYRVNWFHTGADGKFLWPGYGENIRVLEWIHDRIYGKKSVVEGAIGNFPRIEDIDLTGLDLSRETMEELLYVDVPTWLAEFPSRETFMQSFGDRIPPEFWEIHAELEGRLKKAQAAGG